MKWKTDRIKNEWGSMVAGKTPDALVPVALFVDAVSLEVAGKEAIITGIVRTDAEQLTIIRLVNEQRKADGLPLWPETRKTVHQYFRGIDFRSWIYSDVQRLNIIDRVNKRFNYGRNLKVLDHHTNGTAGHLHGQNPNVTEWRM